VGTRRLFPRLAARPIISPATAVTALWTLWVLAWLVAAPATAPSLLRQAASSRLAHAIPTSAGAALLLVPVRHPAILADPLFEVTRGTAWLGVAVVAAGVGFAGWARIALGRFWSIAVTLKAEHRLIRTGPYSWVRHPIYTGLLVALGSSAVLRGTAIAFAGLVLLLLGFLLKIRQEERLLLEHFGASYEVYQTEVPALIPRLPWFTSRRAVGR
jgi:protein-S-isoprenylcysteine O-methyltransferase Ste14